MNDEMELFLKVERGEMTAEEAAHRLEALQREVFNHPKLETPTTPLQVIDSTTPSATGEVGIRQFGSFTRWWIVPFIIGVLVTVLGSFWIYLGWNKGDITFGFWIAWLPFILGIVLMALSWRARASHWIHMRINQGPGRHPNHVTLSFPLPLGLVKWVNRRFGDRFPPEVRGVDLDDLIDSIEESVTSNNPIYLWVDDEKEQQQVEIWIGRGADGRH